MRKSIIKKIRIDDEVTVNKDIYRLEEQYELLQRLNGLPKPEPKTLEEYQAIDWSIWRRQKKLYASKGERGIVIDTFYDTNGGCYKNRVRNYAKVLIDNKIKTFRITSLDKDNL